MNACEATCDKECICKLCIVNLCCDSSNNCLTFRNKIGKISDEEECGSYADWLTKIINPKKYEERLDFMKYKVNTLKVNKKIHENIIEVFYDNNSLHRYM